MPAFAPSAVATAATAVGVADMGAAAAGAGAVLAGGAGTLAGGAEAGALATGAFSSDLPQPVRTTTNAKPVSIVSVQSCVRITPSLRYGSGVWSTNSTLTRRPPPGGTSTS